MFLHLFHYCKEVCFTRTSECLFSTMAFLQQNVRKCPHWKCRNHLCTLDALQTPWAVSRGCCLSSERSVTAWWEKRRFRRHAPNGSLGNRSPKVATTCQFDITLSAKYISMCPGIQEPSFGLAILQSLPAPRSCLFSRPDKPRSSALIAWWDVEKALSAPLHSCLRYDLFAFYFQISLRYWKVEKETSHLAGKTTLRNGTDASLASGSNILWGSAHENQVDRVTSAWFWS